MLKGLKGLRIAVKDYPSLTPYLTHCVKTLCDTGGYVAVLIDAQQVCRPHCWAIAESLLHGPLLA